MDQAILALQKELTGKTRNPPPRPKPVIVAEIKQLQSRAAELRALLKALGC
jgi:hypothetical protein